MLKNPFEDAIEKAWNTRATISPDTTGEIRDAIEATLHSLDCGTLRVAEKLESGKWKVNQWAKKAVLLGFRLQDMHEQEGGPQNSSWWDKVDSKFKNWSKDDWKTVMKAFDISTDEEEKAHISTLGLNLRKIDPSFDPRSYGFKSLTKLFANIEKFEVIKNEVNGLNHPLLKMK